jgi:hypothetical protein
MIWFTWRQFRTQTWVTVGAVAVLGVLLFATGRSIADAYADAKMATCQADCAAAVEIFLAQVYSSASGTLYNFTMSTMYVVPALIGVFWGAPLIARELETGTHRLAWTQSVTRTRWLASKLAIVGAATAATAGILTWAVTSWAHQIDAAIDNRITPFVYGARGIVPVGYALFAVALGVTAGLLIRRTVPAMAATLAVYIPAVAAMPLWIRAHLLPVSHAITPLDTASLEGIMITDDQMTQMTLVGGGHQPGAWMLSNKTITTSGEVFTGPAGNCGPEHTHQECMAWIDTLGLRQELAYQPANNFWPLQWIEFGIFVGAAVLLAGFCFWWTRRRLT